MANKCAKCKYGKRLNHVGIYYCDYLEMTGCKRPITASECKLYEENPKYDKQINDEQKKKQIIIGSRYKAVLTKKKQEE